MVSRNNYTRKKSHWGGIPGTIQIHTVPGLGFNNDPTTAVFRETLPAGFLKCDGTVKNVKDYYLLGQILGVGEETRFLKEGTLVRNADADINDLGQFQLPDLGSKVIIGSRGSGEYFDTTLSNNPNASKVGVEVNPLSNIGDRATVNYIGNMVISAQSGITFNGSPKYNLPKDTSLYSLAIDEFQGHYHTVDGDKGFTILNYSGNHDISGQGKGSTANAANASSGNSLEESAVSIPTGESGHDHTVTRPYTYAHNFRYSYPNINVPLDEMESYIDIDIEDLEVLNQVVTPFILVHYIIKF